MSSPPLLQTRGLTAFYGDAQALFGIDFDLYAGEMVAIIGANGAGKSTFLKCLTGLVKTPADQILLKGQPTGGQHPGTNVRRDERRDSNGAQRSTHGSASSLRLLRIRHRDPRFSADG